MGKSVYSVVLADEIVEAIDQLAYQNHTSRSNMINRILAEKISYLTPERHLAEVFRQVERILLNSGSFQSLMPPSDSMLSMRAKVRYKYNPTLRYSIESVQQGSERHIRLKVLARSQNQALLSEMLSFFQCFAKLEHQEELWSREGNWFIRELPLPKEGVSGKVYGEKVGAYVRLVDECMKAYFADLGNRDTAMEKMARIYQEYQTSNE